MHAFPFRFPAAALLIAASGWLVFPARVARAADTTHASAAVERRLSELEERADRWDAASEELTHIADELESLKNEIDAAGGNSDQAAQLEERIRALEEKLKTHDDRLKGLRRDLDRALAELPDIHLTGEVDLAYAYDFDRPADGHVALRALEHDDDNDFSFEHAKLAAAGSILDTVDARVEVLFGRSAQFLAPLTRGNLGSDDVDVEQVYLSYRVPVGNGLTLTLGKVASRLGAEVIEPPANDPFSRSFIFTLGIPHTYTGLIGSYSFFDGATDVELGVVNGWDSVDDGNDGKTVVGRVADHVSDGLDVALAGTWGAEQPGREGPKRGTGDLIVTVRPVDELSFLLEFLYGHEADAVMPPPDAPSGAPLRDAGWRAFSGIARYDATDKVSLSLRGEVFDDVDGARSGQAQQLWEVTETFAYQVIANLVARVEHRHDESDHAAFGHGQGLSRSQDTASCDVSYRF